MQPMLPGVWFRWGRAACLLALSGGFGPVLAQAPAVPSTSDPSIILRPAPPVPVPAPPPADRPLLERSPPPETSAPAAPSLRFRLQSVQTNPSELLDSQALAATWASQLGQEISLDDVRAIVARINDLYWASGHYAAQAVLPPQRIADGALRLELVEGRVERLVTDSDEPAVQALANQVFGLNPGEIFIGPRLQERLARFNRSSDTRFYARLKPGQAQGTTEVGADVELPQRLELTATAHNEASDSVGRNQLELSANARRLLTGADRLGAVVQKSSGLTNLLLLYSLPVNGVGTRVGATFSSGSTQTVASGLGGLSVDGRSRVVGVNLTHPLPSWRGVDLDLSAGLQRTRTETEIDSFSIGESTTSLRTLAAQGVHRTERFVTSVYLSLNQATYTTPGAPDRKVSTRYLSGSWAWLYSSDWWFNVRGGLQRTSETDIPATLKFSLGNPGDVRGYPSAVVLGDTGQYLVLEAHRRFGDSLDVFAFADNGKVSTTGVADQKLRSVGLGLSKTWSPRLNATASLARPLDQVVADQDSTRFLFRVNWQFY